jgi:SNF2 family DNA or RNA helicase
MNTKAGGESITLDQYCDEMFILDETWITDDQTQLEGRIDNRGQINRPRTFHYIITANTIEESIAKSNRTQAEIANLLLDKRRGVENALKLIGV